MGACRIIIWDDAMNIRHFLLPFRATGLCIQADTHVLIWMCESQRWVVAVPASKTWPFLNQPLNTCLPPPQKERQVLPLVPRCSSPFTTGADPPHSPTKTPFVFLLLHHRRLSQPACSIFSWVSSPSPLLWLQHHLLLSPRCGLDHLLLLILDPLLQWTLLHFSRPSGAFPGQTSCRTM